MTSRSYLRRKIQDKFGGFYTLDKKVCESAAKAVVVAAESAEEARLMLDMLGLIVPQPGYAPRSREEMRERNKAESKARRRLENRMKPTPEEIGEPDDDDSIEFARPVVEPTRIEASSTEESQIRSGEVVPPPNLTQKCEREPSSLSSSGLPGSYTYPPCNAFYAVGKEQAS